MVINDFPRGVWFADFMGKGVRVHVFNKVIQGHIFVVWGLPIVVLPVEDGDGAINTGEMVVDGRDNGSKLPRLKIIREGLGVVAEMHGLDDVKEALELGR